MEDLGQNRNHRRKESEKAKHEEDGFCELGRNEELVRAGNRGRKRRFE